MRDRIWKFTLDPDSPFIDVPAGAAMVAVGEQDGELVTWWRVKPENPTVPRFVMAVPTGVELPAELDGARHAGTVQMRTGLVFHIYVREPASITGSAR